MMSSDYSFRVNDRLYEINGEPISSTLGDFSSLTQLLFRANLRGQERLEHYFIAEHDHYGEPIYRFVSPYLVNLVKLADRDLVAVDLLDDDESREDVDLSRHSYVKNQSPRSH